jgi:hypothetical protein
VHRAARATLPYGVYMFGLRLLRPWSAGIDKPLGRDLYLWTFCVQFATLLYIIFGYAAFTAPAGSSGVGSVSQQLANNQFSGELVLAALGQILLMVADRVAYLFRSHALKAGLHAASALAIHVGIFFYLPPQTQRAFQSNSPLLIFYLLWFAYFCVGGLQLWHGFPRSPPADSLKSAGFNPPMPLLFNIYLAIPFLYELRNVLDWVCATTSLDAYMWFKLCAIHADLFLTQSDMVSRARNRVVLSGAAPQPKTYKFWCGVLLFAGLLLVILLPALIFSTLNPALALNNVSSATATLSVRGPAGTYLLYATGFAASIQGASNVTGQPDYFNQLRANATVQGDPSPISPSWQSATQQVVMPAYPGDAWSISPPGLADLLGQLAAAGNTSGVPNPAGVPTSIYVDLVYAFQRPGPAGNEVASATASASLTVADCAAMGAAIHAAIAPVNGSAAAVDRLGATLGDPVTIFDLYPLALRLPATAPPSALGAVTRSIDVQLHRGNTTGMPSASAAAAAGRRTRVSAHAYADAPLWWTVKMSASADAFGWSTPVGLVFNVVSDKVAPNVLVSSLGSYSVLAVYITVVLAVGRLVRTGFGSPTHRIVFEEMPDASELLELCEGIATARAAKYEGHLKDEMRLYYVLIRLMRSPEILVRITKRKDE